MARIKRLVVPGLPHHVGQRGVRSMDIFDDDDERLLYLRHMRQQGDRFGVTFLAWCLMSDHVHLIAVPAEERSLALGIGEAHRRYTCAKNFSLGVRGYLFEGRFESCVLDDRHLMAAARYVELKPVEAGFVDTPEEYEWSSARFHLDGRRKDPLIRNEDRKLKCFGDDWGAFLGEGVDEVEARRLERGLSTGRPVGSEEFVRRLEKLAGRRLRPRKPGPPRRRKRRKM